MIRIPKAMKGSEMKKYLILLTTAIAITMVSTAFSAPSEPHPGNAMWVEPSSIDLTGRPLGYRFNITVWINFTAIDPGDYIGAWQFTIVYEKAYLNATRVGYTQGTISEWFKNAGVTTTYQVPAVRASYNTTHNYVQHAETWLEGSKASEGSYGSLSWIEFNITATPTDPFYGKFNFTTTGTIRSKLMNENNIDVVGQFLLYEGIYLIPEFTPLVAIISIMIATCISTVLVTKIRKNK